MPIVLPKLPDPDLDETSPYCVIAKHRAKPGKADAYERRMLADLANTRAEPGALQFHIHRDRSDPDLFVICSSSNAWLSASLSKYGVAHRWGSAMTPSSDTSVDSIIFPITSLRVRNGLRDRSGGRMIGSDSLNV